MSQQLTSLKRQTWRRGLKPWRRTLSSHKPVIPSYRTAAHIGRLLAPFRYPTYATVRVGGDRENPLLVRDGVTSQRIMEELRQKIMETGLLPTMLKNGGSMINVIPQRMESQRVELCLKAVSKLSPQPLTLPLPPSWLCRCRNNRRAAALARRRVLVRPACKVAQAHLPMDGVLLASTLAVGHPFLDDRSV
jgi:hypothetical protein